MIFRPKPLALHWCGGDASRNGASFLEIEADFSAEIVTFRLVGGGASPPPPLNLSLSLPLFAGVEKKQRHCATAIEKVAPLVNSVAVPNTAYKYCMEAKHDH